jgi:hypothetical protein
MSDGEEMQLAPPGKSRKVTGDGVKYSSMSGVIARHGFCTVDKCGRIGYIRGAGMVSAAAVGSGEPSLADRAPLVLIS